MPAIVFLFAGMARSYTMPFHLFAGRFDRPVPLSRVHDDGRGATR